MIRQSNRYGMTLVEVMLTAALIGLLAAFILPAVQLSMRGRENAACSLKLREAVQAFELCAAETGSYPADKNPGEIPPEMETYYFPYFKIDWWSEATELGGRWDWDAGYHGFKASVSISSPSRTQEQMVEFDRLLDDGNLDTGIFRKVGTQYHYMIED